MRHGLLLTIAAAGFSFSALADPVPVVIRGVPQQVIPLYPEVGIPAYQMPGGAPQLFRPAPPGVPGGMGSWYDPTVTPGSGSSAMSAMMATEYGMLAATTSQQLGVNPEAMASIGWVESTFRNVPTANGSSSATGPWQIVEGTFNGFSDRYGLGFTEADRTDPAAQAVVAGYVIRDYAATVTREIDRPATVLDTYGAYVFGETAGARIANASASAPLSQFVSARSLANNNVTGWTVGQWRASKGARLGDAAGQLVQVGVG